MKRILWFSIVILMISALPAFSAQPVVSGKIIDILDNGIITIQLSKGHHLRGGDTVSLTYMAGSLPMAIGEYEITTTTNVICLAKPFVMNMPPSNGMVVEIVPIKKSGQGSFTQKPAAVPSPKSPAITVSPIEIIGSVTAVNGDEISVKTISHGTPQVGWFVDLFYVTSQGKDLPVGTWKIQSVAGKTLTATKIKGMGNANKKLKAVIYNKKKSTPSQAAIPPKRTQAISAPFAASHKTTAASNRKPRSQPVQLLGQTAPGKIAPNPRRTPPPPPGVRKTTVKKTVTKPQDPRVVQLLNQLKSTNLREKRTAAKIISRESFKDSTIYNQVEKELLNGYRTARDKLAVDTMAWMCKALASSKNHKYYDTVYTVSRKAKSRKVRKYAKKSLRQLK